MPSRDYWEALWEGHPDNAPPPPGLERRWEFLRGHVCAGTRVLDVGCGDGRLAALLHDAGADVLAADVASEPLRRARERQPGLAVALLEPDGAWELEDNAFDVVWAGEVLEHVFDTARWLSEARRVLRPGGTLLLTTPDHGPLLLAWLALRPRAADAHLHPLSDHVRFYTRRTLARLLNEFHFDAQVRRAGGVPGARHTLLAVARRERPGFASS